MKNLKYLLTFVIIFCCNLSIFAQESGMENTMLKSGKINVVVAVVAVIFIGIVLYLVRMDRKLTKMENEINSNKES
jgi:CcmD family protein